MAPRGDLNIGFSEGYRKINGGLATIAKWIDRHHCTNAC